MTGSEFEFVATVRFAPFQHGFPKSGTDTLATDGFVGDKVLKVGVSSDAGAHGDRHGGNTDDFTVIVDSH